MEEMLTFASACFDLSWNLMKFGMAIAASTGIMRQAMPPVTRPPIARPCPFSSPPDLPIFISATIPRTSAIGARIGKQMPRMPRTRDAIARPYFWETLKNSLVVVGAVVVLAMAVGFLAAVALAKYRFTGNKLFVVLVIGILMLPQVGLVIPVYVVLGKYGLANSLTGLVLVHWVFLIPFAIWTTRSAASTRATR